MSRQNLVHTRLGLELVRRLASEGDRIFTSARARELAPAAVSHWSALHHHGLTDQAPRQVFVLMTPQTSVPRTRAGKSERVGDGAQEVLLW